VLGEWAEGKREEALFQETCHSFAFANPDALHENVIEGIPLGYSTDL
jgi:hypothetical protein